MAGQKKFWVSVVVILVMVISPVRPAVAMDGANTPGEESFAAQVAPDPSASKHRFWRTYPIMEKEASQWAANEAGQEQPEPAFTPPLAVQEDDRLVLTSAQKFVVPGETIDLSLQVSEAPRSAHVVISLPPGVHPGVGNAWAFDDKAREQRLPAQAVEHIHWFVSPEATGPFVFIARLVDGEEVVAESHLALDQAVRGQANAAGGQVRWPERGITVTLPAGAVDEDVDLIIRQAQAQPVAPYSLSGASVVLMALDSEGKEIHSFKQPVSLQIVYDASLFSGEEYSLLIYYYDEASGMW